MSPAFIKEIKERATRIENIFWKKIKKICNDNDKPCPACYCTCIFSYLLIKTLKAWLN